MAWPPHRFTPAVWADSVHSSAQFAKYVYSKLQMYAIPPGLSVIPHFPHDPFISNAIFFLLSILKNFSKLSHLEKSTRNIAEQRGLPSYPHHHDAQTCRV
jgi:hypothetical protein